MKKEEDRKRREKEEEKKKKEDNEREERRRRDENERGQNNFRRGGAGGHNYNNRQNENNNYNNYNNYNRFNQNGSNNNNSYVRKAPKRFDLNEVKALNRIVSENIEIITEMKNAYPGFTQLECASIFKKIKTNNAQTIFEMMNQIHREISIQITINESENRDNNNYLLPIDPYEIIDPFYNNTEHITVMKYYRVYSSDDKLKLPPYIQDLLKPHFLYTNEKNRRRKLIKYPDGGFNYIPIRCGTGDCNDINCIYSHNDSEMEYHPLFYKTKYNSQGGSGILEKTANNLFDDFRIIYNYKNENIINLLKLLDEKKIAKISFKDYLRKNKISSFDLNTFKTLECPSIKNGMTCSKDTHLCYYYHTLSERRRPPSLYRYTNELCQEQSYKSNGKIKSNCKNGDFCNLCHSRYEYYYHKLFYGKAMTCLRPKKNGKCIYEETCYAYHPYKEPGYKKTREEIIQEKKDALLDQYNEEYDLLSELISQYKCQKCKKYNKKFKFYLLIKCDHIICHKCFKEKAKEKKKCPICNQKFDPNSEENEKEKDFIEIDFKQSAINIDDLIKKKYEEKKSIKEKEDEKNEKEGKNNEEEKEKKNDNKKEEKVDNSKEKNSEKSDSDDGKDNNNSMGK